MSSQRLIFAAANVAHHAPQEWADFIEVMAEYVDARREECIQSNFESLQKNQGRAQACIALHNLLAGCVDEANRIETKQAQRPHTPPRPRMAR